ncbi:hypothetical protein SLE2022_242500 [Rubroshorea leprosula]
MSSTSKGHHKSKSHPSPSSSNSPIMGSLQNLFSSKEKFLRLLVIVVNASADRNCFFLQLLGHLLQFRLKALLR